MSISGWLAPALRRNVATASNRRNRPPSPSITGAGGDPPGSSRCDIPIMGGGGSADLTFDHTGERSVTDGSAVVGQMALLAQQPALV